MVCVSITFHISFFSKLSLPKRDLVDFVHRYVRWMEVEKALAQTQVTMTTFRPSFQPCLIEL
jgi:hypothetical protein